MCVRGIGLIVAAVLGLLLPDVTAASTYRYDYRGNPLTVVSTYTGKVFTTAGFRFSVMVDEALLGDTVSNGFGFGITVDTYNYPYDQSTFSWYSDTRTGSLVRYRAGTMIDPNGGITISGMDVFTGAHFGGLRFAVAADGTISWDFFGLYFDYASLFSGMGGDVYNSGQTASEIIRTGPRPQDYDIVYTALNYSAPPGEWSLVAAVPLPATLPLTLLGLAGLVLLARRGRST